MLQRTFTPLLLAALALAVPANAQDRPDAEHKRGAYVVKYAAAKDLSAILTRHFKGAAEIQPGPEGTSNTLLVNATPRVFDEVMKVLELLDRKPQSVQVELFVVELPTKKPDKKEPADIDEKDLSGTLDDVGKALNAMQRKGQVA